MDIRYHIMMPTSSRTHFLAIQSIVIDFCLHDSQMNVFRMVCDNL